jgi:hypothetical protein
MELTINWLALGIITAGIAFIFGLILIGRRIQTAKDRRYQATLAECRDAADGRGGGP